ncbi:MAG: TetR/AcrR family transcriptional regulator [Clostridiales bacterium]|nr:TetR/AcrR family transcriptional regulator [Clostridiales bacterium]
MKNIVREPRQERSIEKKNRIIDAGYELFSEVGYYGTNTAEIAKRAGVSTGIVYGYFQDKRDILISVLEIYIGKVFDPILKLFDKLSAPLDYAKLIPNIIDLIIKTHKKHAKMHEVLHSLSSTDEVVNSEFLALEDSITNKINDKLILLGEKKENLMEKIHFAMNIIQSFAHEYVFDKHEYIDYFVMREMVISSLINLFKN